MPLLRSSTLFASFAAIALVLSACAEEGQSGGDAAAPPPVSVSIVTARPETLPITSELPGRIAPTRIAEVRPRASGIIVEPVFQQGSDVVAGDVLYRIDPEPFRIKVASAQAGLQRAQAVELQAEQQAARTRELRERAVTSAQTLENSEATLAQAEADVASAQAALSSALLELEYSEVKAPIAGRIGRALITEGALVSANGSENLATIQQLDPVYADFTQSANDLLRLRRALQAGLVADADPEEANVRLLLDDGSTYPQSGRLLFSEAAVDATTGQITLRGEFPNPNGDLLPGMYVRVQIDQGRQEDAFAVPQQAVQRDAGGAAQLYVVNAEDILEIKTVRAGRVIGERWVIDEGLSAGDRVVVEGFQQARPGAKVAPAEWRATARDGGSGETPIAPAAQ